MIAKRNGKIFRHDIAQPMSVSESRHLGPIVKAACNDFFRRHGLSTSNDYGTAFGRRHSGRPA